VKTEPAHTTYSWGSSRRFNSYAQHCIRTFGSRLQKLSIDAGFTCPNRDGTKGVGGCTFCLNEAFNPSYCVPEKTITQQINEGIAFHKTRYRRAVKYIAYFQAFSNTYGPLEKLRSAYSEALNHPLVSGISIGTRPDCINDEILDLLQALSQQFHTGIEYGLESCNDDILQAVRREHTHADSESAIRKTAARNIHIGVHLLLGLPGESRQSMLDAAGILSSLPVNSLKIHQLQILKGTAMEQQYRENPEAFHLFSLEEYIDFVIDFLEALSPDILIERLTAEVPPRFLLAPAWGLVRNDRVLQLIEARMEVRNTWQGRKYKP
jgi:uncharacterized protein